jgi:hypothetical protein
VVALRRIVWATPWLVVAATLAYVIWRPAESHNVRFGLYRPSLAQFYLDRSLAPGESLDVAHGAEQMIPFGVPGDTGLVCAQAYVGDRYGLRVYSDGHWFLTRHSNRPERGDVELGQPGDLPFCADFDGDGIPDNGVFRNGEWLVSVDRAGQQAGIHFLFGAPGDRPVVLKVNGAGNASARQGVIYGVYRGGVWHLDTQGTGKVGATHVFGGLPQDLPLLIPRWSTDAHPTPPYSLAIFRDGVWHVKPDPDGLATLSFAFGAPGDLPLVSY